MSKSIPILALLIFILVRAEEEGSGELNLEMTRDGKYAVSCNVATDWSVAVCNGYVREYCEAFCEKKKPLYEERDKANAKDTKKMAKKALKREKNAKLAKEIRTEKEGKELALPTTTTSDPFLDPEYDPEATTTTPPEDEDGENEMAALGGPAVEPPDTNAKTFAEMQVDHLRDETFAKKPEAEEEDLSEFEMYDISFKMMEDSSVTEEKAEEFCQKVSEVSGLQYHLCSLAGADPETPRRIEKPEGNRLIIELKAEGKAAAQAAAENVESTLAKAAAESGIPEPSEMKANYASEGQLMPDTNDLPPDTNSDADENPMTFDTNDIPPDTNSNGDENPMTFDTNENPISDSDSNNMVDTKKLLPDTNSDANESEPVNTTENQLPGSDSNSIVDIYDPLLDTNSDVDESEASDTTENPLPDSDSSSIADESTEAGSSETTGAPLEEKYKPLGGVAESEGNQLNNGSGSLEDAQNACDENGECKSFGYCTNKGDFYLFDKEIGDEQEKVKDDSGDCKTYYRSPTADETTVAESGETTVASSYEEKVAQKKKLEVEKKKAQETLTTGEPLEESAQETSSETAETKSEEAHGAMWDESIQESLKSIQEGYIDYLAMASI